MHSWTISSQLLRCSSSTWCSSLSGQGSCLLLFSNSIHSSSRRTPLSKHKTSENKEIGELWKMKSGHLLFRKCGHQLFPLFYKVMSYETWKVDICFSDFCKGKKQIGRFCKMHIFTSMLFCSLKSIVSVMNFFLSCSEIR